MPGNYPEESMQHSEHRENLKSRIYKVYIKMEEALRSVSCNRTCMYLLLAYLMVTGNKELEIAEGGFMVRFSVLIMDR